MEERKNMRNIEISQVTGEQIGGVPSVGDLGIETRSNARYYYTSPLGVHVHDDKIEQAERIGRLVVERQRRVVLGESIEIASRCVGKFLVKEDVFEELRRSRTLRDRIEAAIPTPHTIRGELEEPQKVWLLIAAVNSSSRRLHESSKDMMRRVNIDRRFEHITPQARVASVRSQGFAFIDEIRVRDIPAIYNLWGTTFGWDEQGIRNRAQNIHVQKEEQPSRKSSWFSGVVDPSGRIAALAVAERLDIPLGYDLGTLSLVESTEWRGRDDVRNLGLVSASVTYLHAQVIRDLSVLSTPPLIFAETNYMSRAYRVGFASGMDVPPRKVRGLSIPQILEQNVEVGDGYEPIGLRDFMVMYLPPEAYTQLYSTQAVRTITGRSEI